MSIIGSNILAGAAGASGAATGYQIERSLRFNSGDTAYLEKSFSSAGNRKAWTWSGWVKKGKITNDRMVLFGGHTATSNTGWLEFGYDDDKFYFTTHGIASQSTRLFRDLSAWHHVVVNYDGAYLKFYSNNVEALSYAFTTDLGINSAGTHRIGRSPYPTTRYFDGYLAEVYFIDGQTLAPTDFGESDSDTGVWNPKSFSGTYGWFDNSQTWSNSLTASAGLSGATNAFDADISNRAVSSQGTNRTLTFAPSSGVSFSSKLEVYCSQGGAVSTPANTSNPTASWNGNVINPGSLGWVTLYSGSGTINSSTPLVINTNDANQFATLHGIKLDGKILIDSGTTGIADNSFYLDFSDNTYSSRLGTDRTGLGLTLPSVEFDGNDHVHLPAGSDFAFGTGDFTVEAFVYHDTTPGNDYIIDGRNSSQTTGTWSLAYNYASTGFQFATGSTALLTASSNPPVGKWFHVAVTRSGTSLKMFIDGKQVASATDSTDFSTSPSTSYIATRYSSQNYFTGNISNLRVVKGTAVYTSEFTVPTTPLANITNTKLLCFQTATTAAKVSTDRAIAAVSPGTLSMGGNPRAEYKGDRSFTVNNLTAADNGYIRGTSGAFFYGSREKLFNGNTGDGLCPGSSGTAGTFDVTVTFNPAISCTSLQVWSANKQNSASGSVSVNGGTHQSVPGTGSYTTLTAPSGGTLSSLVLRRVAASSTNNLFTFHAIKVNGSVLYDVPGEDVDSLVDTPTNHGNDTGAGGEVRGCYATFNPLSIKANQGTMENGNLTLKASGAYYIEGKSTIDVFSVENYSELTVTTASGSDSFAYGIGDADAWVITGGGSYIIYRENGAIISYPGNTTVATVNSYTQGDVLGMAVDSTNVKFYKNGTLQGTYAHGKSGTFFVIAMNVPNTGSAQLDINFGQRAFSYPVSGYKSLCTQNLAEPTIADGSAYFDTVLYTGNAGSLSISDYAFSPDFVWLKQRSLSYYHRLLDTVRGIGSLLYSNYSGAADSQPNSNDNFVSFDSDGFTLGVGIGLNTNNAPMVAWAWDAGANSSKTYTVTVVSDSGNKYRFDGHGTSAVTLDLEEGSTYTFDQSDSSNAGHPLRFSTTSNGTHGGGSEYTTGVVTSGTPGSAGAYTKITIAASAPTLFYYCTQHSGMGGQINTNSTAGATVLSGSLNNYNTDRVWSSGLSVASGSFDQAATNAFNGNNANKARTSGNSVLITLTFSPAITVSNTIELLADTYTGGDFRYTATIDGTTTTKDVTGNNPATFGSGSLTQLTVDNNVGGGRTSLMYVKIDGKTLVDSNITPPTVPSSNSVVRANPTAGFSITKYIGNDTTGAVTQTVPHGLNAVPEMYIVRSLGSGSWYVYHKELGNTKYLSLNSTAGEATSVLWNDTSPNSSVFSVRGGAANTNNQTFIAYSFSSVPGYSLAGSFTGNGSTDGPFVYTNFRVSFLMMKNVVGNDWYIYDYKREAEYNPSTKPLYPNGSYGEQADSRPVDLLSNGFKIRYNQFINPTNVKVVYMAFASNPFKTARAR